MTSPATEERDAEQLRPSAEPSETPDVTTQQNMRRLPLTVSGDQQTVVIVSAPCGTQRERAHDVVDAPAAGALGNDEERASRKGSSSGGSERHPHDIDEIEESLLLEDRNALQEDMSTSSVAFVAGSDDGEDDGQNDSEGAGNGDGRVDSQDAGDAEGGKGAQDPLQEELVQVNEDTGEGDGDQVSPAKHSGTHSGRGTEVRECAEGERTVMDPNASKALNKDGSLLRLFQSEVFDMYLHMHYLYHKREPGIQDYLVNLLYRRSEGEIHFYLPQLCCLCVARYKVSNLYRFLLEKASKSMNLALKTSWLFHASADDTSLDQKSVFLQLSQEVEMAIVNCRPVFSGCGLYTKSGTKDFVPDLFQRRRAVNKLRRAYQLQEGQQKIGRKAHSSAEGDLGEKEAAEPQVGSSEDNKEARQELSAAAQTTNSGELEVERGEQIGAINQQLDGQEKANGALGDSEPRETDAVSAERDGVPQAQDAVVDQVNEDLTTLNTEGNERTCHGPDILNECEKVTGASLDQDSSGGVLHITKSNARKSENLLCTPRPTGSHQFSGSSATRVGAKTPHGKRRVAPGFVRRAAEIQISGAKVRLPSVYAKLGSPFSYSAFRDMALMDGEMQRFIAKQRRCDYYNTVNSFIALVIEVSNRLSFEPDRSLRTVLLRNFLHAVNEWMFCRRCVVAASEGTFTMTGLTIPLAELGSLSSSNTHSAQIVRFIPDECRVLSSKKRAPYLLAFEIADLDEDLQHLPSVFRLSTSELSRTIFAPRISNSARAKNVRASEASDNGGVAGGEIEGTQPAETTVFQLPTVGEMSHGVAPSTGVVANEENKLKEAHVHVPQWSHLYVYGCILDELKKRDLYVEENSTRVAGPEGQTEKRSLLQRRSSRFIVESPLIALRRSIGFQPSSSSSSAASSAATRVRCGEPVAQGTVECSSGASPALEKTTKGDAVKGAEDENKISDQNSEDDARDEKNTSVLRALSKGLKKKINTLETQEGSESGNPVVPSSCVSLLSSRQSELERTQASASSPELLQLGSSDANERQLRSASVDKRFNAKGNVAVIKDPKLFEVKDKRSDGTQGLASPTASPANKIAPEASALAESSSSKRNLPDAYSISSSHIGPAAAKGGHATPRIMSPADTNVAGHLETMTSGSRGTSIIAGTSEGGAISNPGNPTVLAAQAKSVRQKLWGRLWSEKKKIYRETSPYGKIQSWNLACVLVKGGDDVRQEMLASQLIRQLQLIFKEARLPLYLRPYEILVTGANSGIIVFVPDTVSVDYLKRSFGVDSIAKVFEAAFADNPYQAKKLLLEPCRASGEYLLFGQNFIESHAAYSLITYLFQVKDRHNGNYLLDAEGHIVHIDYGFMLTNSPGNVNFESAPFKLTAEFIDIMDGEMSDNYEYFRTLIVRGFLEARKHAERLLLLVEMMLSASKMPCFVAGPEAAFAALKDRFMLNLTEEMCVQKVVDLIDASVNNWRTIQYDNFQRITNGIL